MAMLEGRISNAPHVPRGRAVLDSRAMVRNPVAVFEKYRANHGPTFTVHFGGVKPSMVSTDPIVLEHVLKSKGKEVSFGQLTELRLYLDKGLRLVGPLPAEVQNYTSYAGVPMTARANAEVARAFVRHLGSSDSQAVFAAAGIER